MMKRCRFFWYLLVLFIFIAMISSPAIAEYYLYFTDKINDKVYSLNIDNVDADKIGTIDVGDYPLGIAANPNGNFVYVTNARDDTVSVIDTATDKVLKYISVGDGPTHVYFSKDGSMAYVANYLGNSVSVIDATNHSVVKTIFSVEVNPAAPIINPDTSNLYVMAVDTNKIFIIDTVTNEIDDTVDLTPFFDRSAEWVFHPNGDNYYILENDTGNIHVMDPVSNTIVETIDIVKSSGGGWMTMHPTGDYLYVSRGGEDAGEWSGNPFVPPKSPGCIYTIDTDTYDIISTKCLPGGPISDLTLGDWYAEVTDMVVHPFGPYIYFCMVDPDKYTIGDFDGIGVFNTTTNRYETLNGILGTAKIASMVITPDIDKAPTILQLDTTSQETTCKLTALINPNGLSTTYYIEYGPNNSLDSSTSISNAGMNNKNISVNINIMGLEPSNTYQYRMVAFNYAGTVQSEIQSFTTKSETSSPGGGGGGCLINSLLFE